MLNIKSNVWAEIQHLNTFVIIKPLTILNSFNGHNYTETALTRIDTSCKLSKVHATMTKTCLLMNHILLLYRNYIIMSQEETHHNGSMNTSSKKYAQLEPTPKRAFETASMLCAMKGQYILENGIRVVHPMTILTLTYLNHFICTKCLESGCGACHRNSRIVFFWVN